LKQERSSLEERLLQRFARLKSRAWIETSQIESLRRHGRWLRPAEKPGVD